MAVFKSLKTIFKHPLVLIPDLLLAAFIFAMAQLTWAWTGLKDFLLQQDIPQEIVRNYFVENAATIIWPVILFFVSTLIIGVMEKVIKLELITSLMQKKKLSFIHAWKHRYQYFFRVVLMKIYIFLTYIILLILIFAVIGLIIYLIINPFNSDLAIQVSAISTFVLIIASIVILKLGFLFRYPTLFLTKTKNPLKALNTSFNLFLKNKTFTLITLAIILIMAILFGIISYSLPASFVIIVALIGVLHQTWIDVYIFTRFKEKF